MIDSTTHVHEGSNRYLLLGASSFVGRHLFQQLGHSAAVGTYFNNAKKYMRYFDSVTMSLGEIIRPDERFTHAVILLGDSQPDSCHADIIKSQKLNVTSIVQIIDSLVSYNIIPIFISSQFVFDGVRGGYTEEDTVNPILVYGQQKVAVENYLKDRCEAYLVLRLPHVYGSVKGDRTLLTSWLDQILKGETRIRCAEDQRFSPIYVGDVAEAVRATVENGCVGTYHVAGPQIYARIELLKMLLSKLQDRLDIDIEIEACSINEFAVAEPRPIDVSMNTDKLIRDTGLTLHDAGAVCEQIFRNYLL